MVRQTGPAVFDERDMLVRGTVVRHLLLPGCLEDSKMVIRYLYETYGDQIYISIMNQYTIIKKLKYDELNQKVKDKDYDEIILYAINLGIKNCFCQLDDTSSTKYIPDFNLEGV